MIRSATATENLNPRLSLLGFISLYLLPQAVEIPVGRGLEALDPGRGQDAPVVDFQKALPHLFGQMLRGALRGGKGPVGDISGRGHDPYAAEVDLLLQDIQRRFPDEPGVGAVAVDIENDLAMPHELPEGQDRETG